MTMSGTCPACGVAVLPGYAKCPKCHKPLAQGRRIQTVAGGTVAEDKRFPWQLIAVPLGAVIVIVVLLKLIAGGGDDKPEATTGSDQATGTTAVTTQQTGTTTTQTAEPVVRPNQPAQQAPDPNAAVGELDRALRGRRLWATVEASPPRVDVRSGLCDDPSMRSTIDSVVPVLRGAGLTRLRCVAQSGTVVFERDL